MPYKLIYADLSFAESGNNVSSSVLVFPVESYGKDTRSTTIVVGCWKTHAVESARQLTCGTVLARSCSAADALNLSTVA